MTGVMISTGRLGGGGVAQHTKVRSPLGGRTQCAFSPVLF